MFVSSQKLRQVDLGGSVLSPFHLSIAQIFSSEGGGVVAFLTFPWFVLFFCEVEECRIHP